MAICKARPVMRTLIFLLCVVLACSSGGAWDAATGRWARAQSPLTLAGPLPNGGLFPLGDAIRVRVTPAPTSVTYRLTDAYGPADWMVNGDVFEGTGIVQQDAGGTWLHLPTDRLTRYGFYRLDLFTDRGNLTNLYIGLVDPIIPLGPHNRSPVGFIIEVDPYSEFAAQIGHLGIKWVHFDVPVSRSDAGSVLWALSTAVQTFVSQALANDVTPIFKLIGGAPPGVANYNSAFYQNLRSVALAYRDQVDYWIVGNEIDGCGWWDPCDPAVFVTFLRGVAQTVRSVNPDARILAADLYKGDSTTLRALLQAQQQDPSFVLFDVLTVHYLEEGSGENLSPDGCCGSINAYRQVMQSYGIARPIWNTEALSPLRGGIHWRSGETSYFRGGLAVPLLSPAKTIVGNLAVGAEKVFFYSYNYDQRLLDEYGNPGRTLTERALAVRALADQLQTATYHSRLSGTPSFVEGHIFKNGDETILVIWSNNANQDVEATINGANGAVHLFDPLGNVHPLREVSGQVRFRVHYEPQYVRGFTNLPTVTFGSTTNDAPYFTSQPITTAKVGRSYFYNADAYDPDPTGQPNALVPVSYALVQGPAGMQVDGVSGAVTWQPSQPGQFGVHLRVRDGQGLTATQTFTISVVGSAQNAVPQILSRPRTAFGAVGAPFASNVNATDPDDGALSYQLVQAPDWLAIHSASGFIYGVPPVTGTFPVRVRVVDGQGAQAEQTFTLQIAPGASNTPPVILSGPQVTPLATMAVVSWQTSQPANSRARLGLTCGAWTQTVTLDGWRTSHQVVLGGLTPNTSYCYEVQSVNAAGASDWRGGSFVTQAQEARRYLPAVQR
ncbi:MAG: putative Ig domain-containing protein [Anaerolineae bacterium]|nr:putative Ig domain-containing protein [Candidatus Roseilinea sp.]MDW8449836.1 putative Ig domain-containing protein [Anaerolineae bacterium]